MEQTHHTRWAPTSYKWGWVVTRISRVIAPLIHLFSAYNDLGAYIVDTSKCGRNALFFGGKGAERVGWTWCCFIRLELNSNDLQCIHINYKYTCSGDDGGYSRGGDHIYIYIGREREREGGKTKKHSNLNSSGVASSFRCDLPCRRCREEDGGACQPLAMLELWKM